MQAEFLDRFRQCADKLKTLCVVLKRQGAIAWVHDIGQQMAINFGHRKSDQFAARNRKHTFKRSGDVSQAARKNRWRLKKCLKLATLIIGQVLQRLHEQVYPRRMVVDGAAATVIEFIG